MGEIVYTKTGAALYVNEQWFDTSGRTCPPPDIVDVLARVNADIALLDAPITFDGDSFEAVAYTDRTLINFDGRWTTPNGVPAFVPETMRPLACRTFYCTPWHAGGDDETLAAVELWALGLRDRYAEDRHAF